MQLATLLIGLMAATALWSGVQAINAQARTSYDRAAAAFGGGRTPMLVPANDVTVPQSLFAELRRGGWPVSPVSEGSVRIKGQQLRLIGIEPLSLPRGAGPAPDVAQERIAGLRSVDGQRCCGGRLRAQLGVRDGTSCDRNRSAAAAAAGDARIFHPAGCDGYRLGAANS